MKLEIIIAAIAGLVLSTSSQALTVTINPSADGSLYICEECNTVSDGNYVYMNSYVQGLVKFSTSQISKQISSATLTLNPYGLPLWGKTVDVYGYGTSIAKLDVSDANAGSFLGTLVLPEDLGYGEDAYFDVTSFVASVNSPYVAFNLRSLGDNLFSSLEYNYGHPSQLLVTFVPEPTPISLFILGLLILNFVANKKDVLIAKDSIKISP